MVGGCGIDPVTETDVVAAVCAALERGEGGRIVTPNVDVLRLVRADPAVRAYLADATLVVADGMPLVWASRLAGTPLPERVPGSSLIWSLSYHLARAGRSVYLLGGAPSPATGGSGCGQVDWGAETGGGRRAAAVLTAACPGLHIAGSVSPEYGFERDPALLAEVCGGVVESKPDVVFVGLGFPKQEWLIDVLRPELPGSWFLGCGGAINFVAGDRRRAPLWMQQTGLEWAWRLAGDPRRLTGRYLRHDAPYALRLLAGAALSRARSWRA
jgi:N-acetylglucosaminyldiphosphoundecaprenol N-acetyl-beta-D-mannosaminyltransferase